MNATFPRSSTIERANEHMQKAVFGPITEGASQVAGHMSPFGMQWMAFVPPPLWGAYLSTVYIQGNYKGLMDSPKHYLEAMNLYVKAATEGARVAVG
ncbi:MAG: hypothetical protein ACAI38_11470 [Myxococcota bacterium]|nr:hypothetical protein [Myxococcota bacterium]